MASQAGDTGLILGLERPPGEGNGNPLQYSCLGNPMDSGTYRATVHGVARVRHDLATKHPHTHTHTRKMKEASDAYKGKNRKYIKICFLLSEYKYIKDALKQDKSLLLCVVIWCLCLR